MQPSHEDGYRAMLDEYESAGEPYVFNDAELASADFAAFVADLAAEERGVHEPTFAAQHTLLLVDPVGAIVGEFRLRPGVAEPVEAQHGHVGYNVRPSRRRAGNGLRGLALLRDVARNLGVARLSLLISPDNAASRSLAAAAGARPESGHRFLPDYDGPMELWWLPVAEEPAA